LTVCIAARASDSSIFCAADRMVTVGDIEMESPASKIFMLTNAIVVMPSDEDAALHTQILNDTHRAASEAIASNPTRWPLVSEVVEMYIAARNSMRVKLAERTFLTPLGLTHDTFHDKMFFLEASLVARIAEDLVNYKLPRLSVIIAGQDPLGSHIYEIHDGESGCFNTIGYAAIGAGARHARAHFMLAGQSGGMSPTETLWNTYMAKKRSEVAPGVGEQTNIGMIGPQLGTSTTFSDPANPILTDKLESVYEKTKRMEERARKNAAKEMVEYVNRLEQERKAQQAITQATPTTPPDIDNPQLTAEKGSQSGTS
jgi:hypothetical protein